MPKGYIEYQDRIGSQHELTTPGNRKSDVVISAIEKLEKQLKIAESWLREIGNSVDTYFEKDNRPLEFTLDVLTACGLSAYQALHEIEELDK